MTGSESNDLNVNNSYFDINNGYNLFDVKDGFDHFTGTFPGTNQGVQKALYNCFKRNGSNSDPFSSVMWNEEDNELVEFDFSNLCPPSQDFILAEIINIGNSFYDTLYRRTSGGSGAKKNNETFMGNNEQTLPLKCLYDTLNINLRRKNYDVVINIGKQIITAYPDSTKSLDVISKFYLAAFRTIPNGTVMQDMKSYFELIIQNNPQNTALINKAFYLVQKCKVYMQEYASALQGFQYIIQQNPYSFEGLVASWDYSATSLLIQGGGFIDEDINDTVKSKVDLSKINDNYDNKKFTKKDRNTIVSNVESAVQTEKKKQETKLTKLEIKINSPLENEKKKEEIKKEIRQMKTLNEVIKAKKPKSISEHIMNVSKDVKKIFKASKSDGNKNNKDNGGIPKEFRLGQNYPNPFNPSTKISFELPKDVRVTIVIYDILGREITKLINNEFRAAGKYITEFNASNLSSGIYFYQIRAEDLTGQKGEFIQAKKMLLLK